MTTPTAGSSARDVPDGTDLAALEEFAVDCAAAAGAFIEEARPAELRVATKSSETDPVTQMDSAAERLLRERIAAARPDDACHGEEEEATRGTTGLTWVIDPIDGTVNYVYGYPFYSVSVAVVTGDVTTPGAWRPVAGAVAHPRAGLVYHARRGGGAFARDASGRDEPVRVSGAVDLPTSLIATGFGYDADKRRAQGKALVPVLPRVRDIRRGGSAALDLCHVASGLLDGYYEMGINAWDMAAGWLILTEAGGLLTGLDGRPPSPDLIVGAGQPLHQALHDLVAEALAAFDWSADAPGR